MADGHPAANPTDHLLLRTLRGEAVERAPVWAMRQAGRWDPEFNRLRDGMDFYAFSENVQLSAAASLCPRRFGVDAIILFYDITTLTISMGLPFSLQPSVGPVPAKPVRTMSDVETLNAHPAPDSYRHIRELLAAVQAELAGALPVLVFAGAPFTLASYCIGTGKNLAATREFIASQPQVWEALTQRIESATVEFLNVLAGDGASAYQLFDSWAGELTPEEYMAHAQPNHAAILAQADRIPRILFVKECPYLDLMAQTNPTAISLGARHDLAAALRDYPHLVFQGNVDEAILRTGTPEQVTLATQQCRAAGGSHRHILNLNHGVNKGTPVANFEAFVRAR